VGGTSRKYAFDRLTLPSLWHVQVGTNLTQIVALEEVGFLTSEKPRCSLVNHVGDDNFALVSQPSTCAPWNLFGNGLSAHVYKPSNLNAWPKTRNGKKIQCPNTFKLSILQKNKWDVGRTLKVALLIPLNIILPRYG
jgi:hypothetical protein